MVRPIGQIRPVTQNWGHTEFATVQTVPPLNEVLPTVNWTTVLSVNQDDPGDIISVTLTLPPKEDVLATTFETFAWALVEWGSGGAKEKTIIDYIAGTTFSVPASYLRISAAHFDFTAGNSLNTKRFGAIASVGATAHGLPPQRTMTPLSIVIAGGGNASIAIPPFSKQFSIFAINNATNGSPALTIRQQREDPLILVTSSVQVFGVNAPIERIPIIGLVRKINIQNDDALATDNVTIVYDLAL